MSVIIDKVIHLSEERAVRLGQHASASGTTEAALIEKAIDLLFEISQPLTVHHIGSISARDLAEVEPRLREAVGL